MADYDNRYAQVGTAARTGAATVDEGLRAYMLQVYNYMASAMAVTGLVAYGTHMLAVDGARAAGRLALTPFGQLIYVSPLKWVVMLAPLAFVFFLAFRVYKMSLAGAQVAFWLFAAVMGLSLSTIFLVFTGESITRVFFITAAAFAGLSVFGYTTKKDLSGWGSFLIMGVIGIIIAALVNLFLQSSALQFAISVIGIVVFTGLTAWDTQAIKEQYAENLDNESRQKLAAFGAFSLFLNFINIFQLLLYFTGQQREE